MSKRNETLREKLRIIIFQSDTPLGKAFDVALLWCIVASILLVIVESMQGIPPMLKEVFKVLEYAFTFFFTIEYLCRLYCADRPRHYALSFFGIIDLLSTLPLYIGWIFGPARYLMVARTFRLIRVFRVFKLFSFLQEGDLLMRSLVVSAPKIGVFFLFTVIMVISMGTLMYMVEGDIPGTPFKDIPTSIYWAVVTMTTVGYGDIAPLTHVGRIFSAIVMLMGYTIMAVPTGIVSAQMVHDHKKKDEPQGHCPECGSPLPHGSHYCPFCGLKQEIKKDAAKVLPVIMALLMGCGLTATAQDQLLTGTVIGTRLSVDYSTGQSSTTVNTATNAFDGDLSTYFATYDRSRTWCGLDLGEPHVITRIGWSPRNDGLGPRRMLLALFEGANDPNFLDAVPLHLIDKEGRIGEMSYADCEVTRGFRYVRYIGPADARCNVAEVAFYGHPGEGDDSHFHQITNLPTLTFHTLDGIDPYDKVHDLASNIAIIYADGAMIQEETGTTRLRGNASMAHPKKPYRIKFDNSRHIFKGSDERSPAKAKKWTLINNYDDKTLMRNLVAFEIARRMGMDYVPWSKPVDVIVNGEYRGCYQLTDQLTVDKNRINITQMEATDTEGEALTGGYLLELDGYANQEVSWFTSSAGNPVTIKSPDEDKITPEQSAYIRRDFGLMEAKILASNFDDPDMGFRSKLDERSLLQYFLVEELAGNPDAFWSCYITKERGEDRYRLGPVWDFDNAFDNDYRNFPTNDQGDYLSLARGGAGNSRALLKRLFSDPALSDAMATMWNASRESGDVTGTGLTAYIDSTANELMQSQRLNFMRWPILDQIIQVNPRAGGSYDVEVGWIKEYVGNRVAWLDNFINNGTIHEADTISIATAGQLADFAQAVNSGKPSLNARLTADIDMTAYPDFIIGTAGFKGDFDGGGHSITLAQKRYADYAGLFHTVGGHVHDVTVAGSITTSSKYAGGIAGSVDKGTVARCQSRVTINSNVNGDGTHGGVAGLTNNGAIIENCLVAATLNGWQTNSCGGVTGWASGQTTIRNCLVCNQYSISASGSDQISRNASNVNSTNNYCTDSWNAANACSDVTLLTDFQVTYGEACFRLEGRQPGSSCWRQTLGMDDTPVPDTRHSIVYSIEHLHCDGTPYASYGSFTNNASRNGQDRHDFQNGTCSVCGLININSVPRDERGYYQLGTPEALKWFATMVGQGNVNISAVLTADIDMTADPAFIIAGSNTYGGTFDGGGHTITLNQQRNGDYAGLFGHVSGTIQDLTLRGDITTSGKYAGMVSELHGGMMLRCQSYIDIHSRVNGDGTHGGLAGLFSEGSGIGQIQDCIFAGSIQGDRTTCCGGLVGWATVTGIIQNCLMLGRFSLNPEGCDMICRNSTNAILMNTYYAEGWNVPVPADALVADDYDLASGALCYRLNDGRKDNARAWYQTLSEDAYPVPDRTHLPVWLYEGMYINEDPDAIVAPMAAGRDTGVYDLSGRRLVGTPQRGIYIINNRKYVK